MSDILAAIVRAEPDWGALPETTPPKFAIYCVAACRRIRNVACAISATPASKSRDCSAAPANATPGKPLRHQFASRLTARAVLARDLCCSSRLQGIAVWKLKPSPPSAPQPTGHFLLPMPPATSGWSQIFRICPLYFRRTGLIWPLLATEAPIRSSTYGPSRGRDLALQGTDGATNPFFSPDGRWLAFFAQGKLKKVPTSGGTPVVLCDASSSRGGNWGTTAPSFLLRKLEVSVFFKSPPTEARQNRLPPWTPPKGKRATANPNYCPAGKRCCSQLMVPPIRMYPSSRNL